MRLGEGGFNTPLKKWQPDCRTPKVQMGQQQKKTMLVLHPVLCVEWPSKRGYGYGKKKQKSVKRKGLDRGVWRGISGFWVEKMVRLARQRDSIRKS